MGVTTLAQDRLCAQDGCLCARVGGVVCVPVSLREYLMASTIQEVSEPIFVELLLQGTICILPHWLQSWLHPHHG